MEPLGALTIRKLVERSVAAFGSRPALSMVDGPPITYAQLGEHVRTLAGVLADRGVRPRDRVAILGESCPHWGLAYFAVTTMGAIAVPILPDFQATQVQHILRHSGARALFVAADANVVTPPAADQSQQGDDLRVLTDVLPKRCSKSVTSGTCF